MTEPTLRKPTKKAFFFPTSGATPVEIEAKPATKTPKRAAETTRSKREKTKARVTEVAKTEVAKPVAEAAEATSKAKGKRAKKDGAKKDSPRKEKVVRDSFTMPRADYEKIAILKKKCLDAGVQVKKSELLRAALQLLASTSEKRLLAAIAAVETVKTGRPSKSA